MVISPLGNFLSGLIGEYIPTGILFTCSAILGLSLMLIVYFVSPAKHLDKVIKQKLAAQKDEESKEASIKEAEEDEEKRQEAFLELKAPIEKEDTLLTDRKVAAGEGGE
jgi:hypothetical protein